MWTHGRWLINLTLVIDDLSVKYSGKDNALHLKEEPE